MARFLPGPGGGESELLGIQRRDLLDLTLIELVNIRLLTEGTELDRAISTTGGRIRAPETLRKTVVGIWSRPRR